MKSKHHILISVCLLFLVTACKKTSNPLGLEVQPEYDQLQANVTEVQPVSMYTVYNDSIFSFNSSLKYLGSNQDPAFGRTDVGLYLNANLPVSNLKFGTQAQITSAEIILEASGLEYTGDASTIINYSVYALDSSLSVNRVYLSNNTGLHNTNSVVAAYTGSYSTIEGKVVLRIPVDTVFAGKLMRDTAALVDNTKFQSKYKGFYISCQSTQLNPVSAQGIVTLFDLSTALSGLYLRYKATPGATEESFRFTFTGDASVRFNTVDYKANEGGNYLLTQQIKGDTALGKQNTFLKGLGATIVKVQIPGLKASPDSFFVSVNRAEVIFNIDESFLPATGKYEAPPILTLIPLDQNGKESLGSHSYNVSNLSRYNGKYDSEKKRYVFDIARFVQLVMNGDRKNYGFNLVVADPDISKVVFRDQYQNRVVFHGLNKLDLKPKCNLYYVKMSEL
jgi:hypothetical protein